MTSKLKDLRGCSSHYLQGRRHILYVGTTTGRTACRCSH